jgi:hypothetical protein
MTGHKCRATRGGVPCGFPASAQSDPSWRLCSACLFAKGETEARYARQPPKKAPDVPRVHDRSDYSAENFGAFLKRRP